MRRRFFGFVTLGLTVSLLALGLASCGGDDDDTQTSPAETTSTGGGEEASGEPIKMQFIAAWDNPIYDVHQIIYGAEAAAEAINAEGGIDGRPIQVVPCNELVDPNRAARCAREAVSEDVVATMVMSPAGSGQIYPIIEDGEVPAIGSFVTEPIDTQSKVAYPIFGGSSLINQAFPGALKEEGYESMSGLVEGRASTVTDVEAWEAGSEFSGVEFKGAEGYPPETTDFSTTIQRLSDLDSDVTVVLSTEAALTALLATNQELGSGLQFATGGFVVFPSTLEESGAASDGLLTLNYLPPASAGDEFPAIAQFNEEMDAAGMDGKNDRDTFGMQGWFALHAMALVAERIDGEITNQSMIAELDTKEPVDLLGLLEWIPAGEGPAPFDRLANGLMYQAEVKGGEPILTNNDPVDAYTLAGLE